MALNQYVLLSQRSVFSYFVGENRNWGKNQKQNISILFDCLCKEVFKKTWPVNTEFMQVHQTDNKLLDLSICLEFNLANSVTMNSYYYITLII